MINGYYEFSDYLEVLRTSLRFNNWVDMSEYFYAAYSDAKEKNPRFIHFLLLAQCEIIEGLPEQKIDDLDSAIVELCDSLHALTVVEGVQKESIMAAGTKPSKYVTRDHAIAEYFKGRADYIEPLHGRKKYMWETYGKNFYNHWKEIEYGDNMKPENLCKAIELLEDFPKAKEDAIKKLKEIEK